MSSAQVIDSGTALEDLSTHFHVSAGPGAGKTHWLAIQIAKLVQASDKIGVHQRVACISYTNVAVDELRSRLKSAADKVDSATIHSFLYRNVVRPYLHLLMGHAEFAALNHKLVDGHDEHRPSFKFIQEWHQQNSKHFNTSNLKDAVRYLKSLRWVRQADQSWKLTPRSRAPAPTYLPTRSLSNYRDPYWKCGIVDHEDVIYFAYRILELHPTLAEFISAKYPYIILDEFQDTTPAQVQIVRWLGRASKIGVIGDLAQSIYDFQGASPQEFANFQLPEMKKLEIRNNRRSTRSIVGFLNHLRPDYLQDPVRGEEGSRVEVRVGTSAEIYADLRTKFPATVVLARTHAELGACHSVGQGDLWEAVYEADPARAEFLEKVIRGGQLANSGSIGRAFRELGEAFRWRKGCFRRKDVLKDTAFSEAEAKGIVLSVLQFLAKEWPGFQSLTLTALYDALGKFLAGFNGQLLRGVNKTGKFYLAAEAIVVSALATSTRGNSSSALARTIHQAKGDQFETVLVLVKDEKSLLDVLNSPNLEGSEDHRIFYVASSRAMERLVVCVPTAKSGLVKELEKLNSVLSFQSASAKQEEPE